jgi:RNA polymerase sigma factor (sigma-70 family)
MLLIKAEESVPLHLDAMLAPLPETDGTSRRPATVEEPKPLGATIQALSSECDPYRLAEQIAKGKTRGRHYRDDVLGDALLAVAQGTTDRGEIENAVRKSMRREWKFVEIHAPLNDADDRQCIGPPERARLGVWDEVNRLPRRQRQAVVLIFWAGLTEEEAAKEMGCSQVGVHIHVKRATAKLRQKFLALLIKSRSSMPYVSEGGIRIRKSRSAKCGEKGQPAC